MWDDPPRQGLPGSPDSKEPSFDQIWPYVRAFIIICIAMSIMGRESRAGLGTMLLADFVSVFGGLTLLVVESARLADRAAGSPPHSDGERDEQLTDATTPEDATPRDRTPTPEPRPQPPPATDRPGAPATDAAVPARFTPLEIAGSLLALVVLLLIVTEGLLAATLVGAGGLCLLGLISVISRAGGW